MTKTKNRQIRASSPARAAHSKRNASAYPPPLSRPTKSAASRKQVNYRRSLYKRFALHPLHILFLLCVGVLLVTWTFRVTADSYQVTATVPAPPLTQGAVITAPSDGQIITSVPLTVEGQCPQDSYVQLTRNGQFSGVAWCVNGTFQIQTGLYDGSNTLNAQDYNVTNQAGPSTPDVVVTYSPPPPPPPSSGTVVVEGAVNNAGKLTGSLKPSAGPPLLLTSSFSFQSFVTGNSFAWNVDLEGGTPPYTVTVDWGDHTQSKLVFKTDPTFTIRHTYAHPGYYKIQLMAVDARGNVQYLQLAAFIRSAGAPFLSQQSTSPPSKSSTEFLNQLKGFMAHSKSWLMLIWPSYAVVVLMVFSFWLGEKEEYKLLNRVRPKR